MPTHRVSAPRRRVRRTVAALSVAAAARGAFAGSAAAADATPVKPIASLDVQRYLGEWRQIAAIPQWYETLCTGDTAANYSLNADGTVRVSNRCVGPLRTNVATRGRARILDKTTNAQLQVTFVGLPGGLWFYPNSTPNYIVMGLGANYDWAVVGDPDRSSGFFLSRTATVTTAQKDAALAALRANGYDPCKLQLTKQSNGSAGGKSLCTL